MRRAIIAIGVLAAVVVLGWTAYRYIGGTHAEQKPGAASNPTVPVTPASPKRGTCRSMCAASAPSRPSTPSPIKSRVDGQIVKVDFTEGQEVKAGDPLFQIDPRPFQAALDAGAGQPRQKDEAQLTSAAARSRRATPSCVGPASRRGRAIDQQKATVGQLQGCDQGRSGADRQRAAQSRLRRRSARRSTGAPARAWSISAISSRRPTTPASSRSRRCRPIFVSFTVPQDQLDAHPPEPGGRRR